LFRLADAIIFRKDYSPPLVCHLDPISFIDARSNAIEVERDSRDLISIHHRHHHLVDHEAKNKTLKISKLRRGRIPSPLATDGSPVGREERTKPVTQKRAVIMVVLEEEAYISVDSC
jgi:hypothetical protein